MEKAKVIFKRFLKGFISGACASMVTLFGVITKENGIYTLADLKLMATTLLFSGLVGGVSGGILAVDKYMRWVDNQTV